MTLIFSIVDLRLVTVTNSHSRDERFEFSFYSKIVTLKKLVNLEWVCLGVWRVVGGGKSIRSYISELGSAAVVWFVYQNILEEVLLY